ncbi:class II fructose-bisphosphate aldolase [Ammoniphilus sp. CFH 90114]|uniref:class II fructose-bisphosphate aldolase n=1 Tax=Ammoniphilus sp. CFH 90114 TaxID=2493665 RepID=UPI00100E76DD|nr:class II fructose-bisphosphate aldolase [Ammoniphilus sp. CFH 90114]RXT07026.1 class II fructose-bisphosphate aldolase [Ammoniphilus sp. CFH 90114]
MKLVKGTDLLYHALENQYAVGAFSIHTAEMVKGVLAAAEEEKAPIMLQIGQRAIRNSGFKTLINYIHHFGHQVSIPVSIHLDHGNSFEQVMVALQQGCTSVMFDGSHRPLETNIAITKQVVQAAHACGVSVEAELGKIAGVEDDLSVDEKDAFYTDPEEALYFYQETGVDSLAVAIGSAHGLYKQEPKLDLARLNQIYQAIRIPIVLHGGSGIPAEQIREAIPLGISKINVDTELRAAYTEGLKASLEERGSSLDPYRYQLDAEERMKEIVRQKIRVFQSNNQVR